MTTITHTATYSPEDNKLRMYPACRLDAAEYARMKHAGFSWAPKQELFVAPMWTPDREDLLESLCGEIGDEDTSLTERAEERAERFEEYSDKRATDAARARDAVEAVAGGIPFGQPILIGHHSERHARRDAEKIKDGMRRAVRMWETSNYWTSRAAGAIRHAKYKELPPVRHRRIKGLESDFRKQEKIISDARADLAMWQKVCGEGSTFGPRDGREVSETERAIFVLGRMTGYDGMCFPLDKFPRNPPTSQYEGAMGLYSGLKEGIITFDQAREFFHEKCAARIAWAERWAGHYSNRIAYERAMLAESGGIVAEKYEIVTGGRVSCGGQWYTVAKLNRSGGRVVSVSVVGKRYGGAIGIEEIKAYEAPSEERAAAVAAAIKTPKLCNYAGVGFIAVTQAQWDSIDKDYKGTRPLGKGAPRSKYGGGVPDIPPDETKGLHRVRVAMWAMLRRAGVAEMPPARATQYGYTDTHGLYPCYISDAKQTPAPPLPSEDEVQPLRAVEFAAVPVATKRPETCGTIAETLEAVTEEMFTLSDSGARRYGIKYEYAGEEVADCYQFHTLDDLIECAREYQKQERMNSFSLVTHEGEYKGMRTIYKWAAWEEWAPAPESVKPATDSDSSAMRDALRTGVAVQAVSAPQLFPTPPELARRVVELAEIEPGQCVLEPSAGTGNLCRAVIQSVDTEILAYEINSAVCSQLARTLPNHKVKAVCKDFLQVEEFMGCYPRIVMNPPFADSQDIAHVRHAYKFLAPGGRMVAIMGEGAFYRQDRAASGFRDWLEEIGGTSEKLPAGSFETSGTGVNARLVVIQRGN